MSKRIIQCFVFINFCYFQSKSILHFYWCMPFQKCHAQKCFLSCSYFMLHLKTFNIALLGILSSWWLDSNKRYQTQCCFVVCFTLSVGHRLFYSTLLRFPQSLKDYMRCKWLTEWNFCTNDIGRSRTCLNFGLGGRGVCLGSEARRHSFKDFGLK